MKNCSGQTQEKYRNKGWLASEHNSGLSMREMAESAGCVLSTIFYWMKKFQLPREFLGIKGKGNSIEISNELHEILDGELLGDGHLEILNYNHSARYAHTSKFHIYLNWLFNEFESYGLKWNKKISEHEGGYGTDVFHARTFSYRELKNEHERWYPIGKKIIPKDINLTPKVLKHWYIGDGTLHLRRKRREISFATHSFCKSDIEILIKKFEGLNIHATCNNKEGVIYISKQNSVNTFFDYMENCNEEIQDIYGYKWRTES